jgi:hypothetical protein
MHAAVAVSVWCGDCTGISPTTPIECRAPDDSGESTRCTLSCELATCSARRAARQLPREAIDILLTVAFCGRALLVFEAASDGARRGNGR